MKPQAGRPYYKGRVSYGTGMKKLKRLGRRDRPGKGGETMRKYEILLALSDENAHSLKEFGSTLENRGYRVTTVTGSGAPMGTPHGQDFDLVLTDLLPVLEIAREKNPEIMAILILTNHCRLSHAFRSDADDYLFQPFDMTELAMRVATCIERFELAQRNSQKITNMLKIMSHDIRGSLVSISAILKLLMRGYYGKMGEGVANRLKELLSKTTGLIGTTEEYLDRTFSLDDDSEREGEALNLMQDIINPVLKELSSELKDHPILFDHRFDGVSGKTSVKGSRTWLKAVFRNLLKNAIKYGDAGCTIAIGFEDHGSSFQLNVYNSGKPIPEEWRDKLFSEYVRVGRENDGPDGVGLGLYLVKDILQKQGGDIWYEAKENGSNFIFTLPHG